MLIDATNIDITNNHSEITPITDSLNLFIRVDDSNENSNEKTRLMNEYLPDEETDDTFSPHNEQEIPPPNDITSSSEISSSNEIPPSKVRGRILTFEESGVRRRP